MYTLVCWKGAKKLIVVNSCKMLLHPFIHPYISLSPSLSSSLVSFIVWPPDGVTTGVGGWWRENEGVQGVSKMGGIKRERERKREWERDEGSEEAKNRGVKKYLETEKRVKSINVC